MKKNVQTKGKKNTQKALGVRISIIALIIIALPLSYLAANSKIGEQTTNNSRADSSQQGINTSYCKEKGCYWIIGNITPFSGNPSTTAWNMKVVLDGTLQNHEGNIVCSLYDEKGSLSQVLGNKNFNSLPFIWNLQFHANGSMTQSAKGMYAKCKAVINADNTHGITWNSSLITFTH